MQAAVDEYEARETLEAQVARDADKLECLFQAVEYREQGYSLTQNWIDTSLASLTTTSAKSLPEAALNGSSLDWQKNVRPPDPRPTRKAPSIALGALLLVVRHLSATGSDRRLAGAGSPLRAPHRRSSPGSMPTSAALSTLVVLTAEGGRMSWREKVMLSAVLVIVGSFLYAIFIEDSFGLYLPVIAAFVVLIAVGSSDGNSDGDSGGGSGHSGRSSDDDGFGCGGCGGD